MEHHVERTSLVCGGAGFIGSHLCETLLARGRRVICVDNLYTGNMGNIFHLMENPDFSFIRQDIVSLFHLDETGIDEIYNLACPASPVHYQAAPIETMKASVIGTLNLLELARLNHCRFLQASTSEVYGDAEITPQSENYWGHVNPNGIRSCYDEGKRCAESLCMDYYRQYGLQVKIIRIFNTYGPRMATGDGRVIPNFIMQALQGESLTVYGDGSHTRSFMFVGDLVRGILSMMSTSGDFTGPVNLGNPEECTILELASRIKEMTGSCSDIVYCPLPLDDPRRRVPDITLAREMLDWNPVNSLQVGLEKTVRYFKKMCGCQPDSLLGVRKEIGIIV